MADGDEEMDCQIVFVSQPTFTHLERLKALERKKKKKKLLSSQGRILFGKWKKSLPMDKKIIAVVYEFLLERLKYAFSKMEF